MEVQRIRASGALLDFGAVLAFVFEQHAALHFGLRRRFGRHLTLDARLAGRLEHTRLWRANSARRPAAPVPRVHLHQRRVVGR